MATEVIKRDGSREPFLEEKVRRSIAASARDAGITEDRALGIADEAAAAVMDAAGQVEAMETSAIAEIILSELDRIEPAAAESWRAHVRSKE